MARRLVIHSLLHQADDSFDAGSKRQYLEVFQPILALGKEPCVLLHLSSAKKAGLLSSGIIFNRNIYIAGDLLISDSDSR